MTENEYRFTKNIVNLDKDIAEALEYIRDNFNVYGEFDEDNLVLSVENNNINEGLNISKAKEYLENKFEFKLIDIQ